MLNPKTSAYGEILAREGLADWKIIDSPDAYCRIESKTIELPNYATFALFLHEVAHALYPFPEPQEQGYHYHGGAWASTFARLIETYTVPRPLKGDTVSETTFDPNAADTEMRERRAARERFEMDGVVSNASYFDDSETYHECRNCGARRFIHDAVLEQCLVCGDDETDLSIEVRI